MKTAKVGLLILFICNCASAATIRIQQDQSTIQAGIDAAVDEDTVLVAPGEYVENITVSGKGFVILSESGRNQTTLSPSNSIGVVLR